MKIENIPIVVFVCVVAVLVLGMLHPEQKEAMDLTNRHVEIEKLTSVTTGQKFIPKGRFVLHVFASWCEACKRDQEKLQMLSIRDRVYGLAWQEDKDNAKKMKKIYNDILLDKSDEIAINLGIRGMPETFVIGSDGKVLYNLRGMLTEEIINNAILPKFAEDREIKSE